MNENNIEWTKLAEVNSFQDNPQQLLKIKRDDILVIKDEEKFYALFDDPKSKEFDSKFNSTDTVYSLQKVE